MKKILVLISIIVISIGLYLGYRVMTQPKGEALYNLVTVEKGEIVQKVSVTGSIISDQSIDLQFETIGKVKEILVQVGQQVQIGDTLISLENNELVAEVSAASAVLSMAQAKKNKILEGTREEEIAVYQAAVANKKDALTAAETDLVNAKQDLVDVETDAQNDLDQDYEDGLDSTRSVYTKADNSLMVINDIQEAYFAGSSQLGLTVQQKEKKANNDLSNAKTVLDTAEATLAQTDIDLALKELKSALLTIREALSYIRTSMDDPTINPSSANVTKIDTERTTTDTSMSALTSSQQTISSTKITNQTNINTAQANIDGAEDDVRVAQSSLQKAKDELTLKEAGASQADIDLAKAEVRQAQAKLRQAQGKLTKVILKAPVTATVTAINFELGETVATSQVAISLINTVSFQIEANVSETDIAKIGLDNEVEMTLDAFGPDEKFYGSVMQIDPAETVISGVIYYKVKSIFEYKDPRIKSGMTVNLDIVTDKKENTLYLPFFVLKQKNQHKYVEILQNNQVIEKTIKTGLDGETNIEILEGLEAGDQVIAGEK